MPKPPNPYRRLPGTGNSAFEHVLLYLGADHLLQVSSSGFTETYRRFYFCDIQSITLRKTIHGKLWNVVLLPLAIVFGLVAHQEVGPTEFVWWAGEAVFLVMLGLNIAHGPTCACQIRTAVQTRPLPSLHRLQRASKILAQLKPLIEAAQGTMPAEELSRRIDESRRGPAAALATPIEAGARQAIG
jgi:hypothetical protein